MSGDSHAVMAEEIARLRAQLLIERLRAEVSRLRAQVAMLEAQCRTLSSSLAIQRETTRETTRGAI